MKRELKFKRIYRWDHDFKNSYFDVKKGDFYVDFITLNEGHTVLNRTVVSPYLQYTGLKDKNGKEIYEGDIFKGSDYKWDAVQFEDGQFQVNLIGARVFSLQELCCDIDYELPEVIGNVFENPELLK